jgi:hypothetical protein
MSRELKPLALDAGMQQVLPLAYRRIMVSDEVLDEKTVQILTLHLPKFRHSSMFVRRPKKQISKPDL